jgi:hypothetical protein
VVYLSHDMIYLFLSSKSGLFLYLLMPIPYHLCLLFFLRHYFLFSFLFFFTCTFPPFVLLHSNHFLTCLVRMLFYLIFIYLFIYIFIYLPNKAFHCKGFVCSPIQPLPIHSHTYLFAIQKFL